MSKGGGRPSLSANAKVILSSLGYRHNLSKTEAVEIALKAVEKVIEEDPDWFQDQLFKVLKGVS
jgi:20S proteasome alpha/beta subunit